MRTWETTTGSTNFQQYAINYLQKCATEIIDFYNITNKNVIEEVAYQIVICIQLGIQLEDYQVKEMLLCQNEIQVERKARNYKFA